MNYHECWPDEFTACPKCGGMASSTSADQREIHYSCDACEIFFIFDRKTLKTGKIETHAEFMKREEKK